MRPQHRRATAAMPTTAEKMSRRQAQLGGARIAHSLAIGQIQCAGTLLHVSVIAEPLLAEDQQRPGTPCQVAATTSCTATFTL